MDSDDLIVSFPYYTSTTFPNLSYALFYFVDSHAFCVFLNAYFGPLNNFVVIQFPHQGILGSNYCELGRLNYVVCIKNIKA